MGREKRRAAAFGHAIEFDEAAGPALEHVSLQRGGKGGAGRELEDVARKIVFPEIIALHDPAILHRNEHRMGRAALLRKAKEFPSVELGHQHGGGAMRQRRKENNEGRI